MKAKKLFLTAAILIAAVVLMAVYGAVTSIVKEPVITENEFPFSITYELNGETKTMEGIYAVAFTGFGGYVDPTERNYEGQVISQHEGADTSFVLGEVEDGVIMIYTKFHPDYLMGETYYDYFSDEEFRPVLIYEDPDGASYEDEEIVLEHGAKIISWEYPEPVENSYVFSHITYLCGNVVIPFALIAAAALLAVVIFVKKDEDLRRKSIDKLSVVLNFVIALTALPFMTIYGLLSDINGSSPELLHQLGYLAPAITILGLAASVGLRRKGFRKGSFISQFTGPAFFAVLFVCIFISETF